MIVPEKMRKSLIVGPKNQQAKVIDYLHKQKIVHIIDHKKGDLDLGEPTEKAETLSGALVTVRTLKSHLGIKETKNLENGIRATGVKNFSEFEKVIKSIENKVGEASNSIKTSEDEIKKLNNSLRELEIAKSIGISLENYSEYSSLAFVVGNLKKVAELEQDLRNSEINHKVFPSNGNSPVAIFFEKGKKDELSKILSKNYFTETIVPELGGRKGNAEDAIKEIIPKKLEHLKNIDEMQKTLLQLKREKENFLLLAENYLAIELEKAEAPLRLGSSKNAFFITGWIREKKVHQIEKEIDELTSGKIYFHKLEIEESDKVPVKLDNPGAVKPFEFFLHLYSLPKHNEIDPTLFMFITFPFFFGFILGDIGYGITTLLLFLFLKKKIPGAASILNVMVLSSISSIIFGFVFGEVFGLEVVFGYHLPHLISRIHQINELIIVGSAIGVVHINFGLIIGFINELKQGIMTAIFEKVSWMVIQIGIALIALSFMGQLQISRYVGISVFVVGVLMLLKGESIRGMIELPSIISNTLSYSRLAAVGLASAGLAGVVNSMAGEAISAGGIGIVLGIFIVIIGHVINIALGILGGFLHSVRLHYVEFFSKFYKGGAQEYVPFGTKYH